MSKFGRSSGSSSRGSFNGRRSSPSSSRGSSRDSSRGRSSSSRGRSEGGSRASGRSDGAPSRRSKYSKDSFTGNRESPRSRETKRNSRNRRDFEMTKVICASCRTECEVPFKPTTNDPVYCKNCFAGKDKKNFEKPSFEKHSSKDLDMINEKLDKIMKALEIN